MRGCEARQGPCWRTCPPCKQPCLCSGCCPQHPPPKPLLCPGSAPALQHDKAPRDPWPEEGVCSVSIIPTGCVGGQSQDKASGRPGPGPPGSTAGCCEVWLQAPLRVSPALPPRSGSAAEAGCDFLLFPALQALAVAFPPPALLRETITHARPSLPRKAMCLG